MHTQVERGHWRVMHSAPKNGRGYEACSKKDGLVESFVTDCWSMSSSNVTSNTVSKSNWKRPGARTGGAEYLYTCTLSGTEYLYALSGTEHLYILYRGLNIYMILYQGLNIYILYQGLRHLYALSGTEHLYILFKV